MMSIETKHLLLREPKVEDAAAYTAIHNSEFVLRYNAMQPTTPERMAAKFADPAYCAETVFLEHKESGRLIGAIFLEEDDLRYGVASRSLSYFIGEGFSRRGYMKEAMRALLSRMFADGELECVCCRAFVPNTASRALLRSLGFRENGIIPRCVKGYTGEIFDDVIHTIFPENMK